MSDPDIYSDGSAILQEILYSTSMKTDSSVLVYRQKEQASDEVQQSFNWEKRIKVSTSSESSVRNHSAEDGLGGSPLKLQQFNMDCPLLDTFDTDVSSGNSSKREIPGSPVDVVWARNILSCKRKKYGGKPLWVYCNGQDPLGIVLLGCFEEPHKDENKVVFHTYQVTSKGPYIEKDLPSLPDIAKECFPKLTYSQVETRCYGEYDMSGDGTDDALQSTLKIRLEWDKVQSLLQKPPLDAKASVELSVCEGNMRSPVYSLFQELLTLKELVSAVREGVVGWTTQSQDQSILHKVREMLEGLKRGDYSKRLSEEEEDNKTPVKGTMFLVQREDLDFTELLWNILKACSCYEDLVACLKLTLNYLQSGQIQPMVQKGNKSYLAKLVRDSYYGKMEMPNLEGLKAIELLIEIGISKLQGDYSCIFIGKDLVAGSFLMHFLDTDCSNQEQVDLLRKLHSAYEIAVMLDYSLHLPNPTLGAAVRQALTYYKKHELDRNHVFSIPVNMRCITDKLGRCLSSMMKVEMRGEICKQTACTTLVLTNKPVLHKTSSISDDTVSEEHFLHYYLTTECEHIDVF